MRHKVTDFVSSAQIDLKAVPLDSPRLGESGGVIFILFDSLNVSIELSLLWWKRFISVSL